MTDLYSKASLILTSNAFSQSKAYAVKPSTGTGDFTFSRSTASGSRIKSDGTIEFVRTDVPRLNYPILQQSTTNLLRYSNDFSTVWTKGNSSITSSAIISPDGTLNGWKLNESVTATADQHYVVQQNPSLPNLYTFSIFAKAAERSGIRLATYGTNPANETTYPEASFNISSSGGSIISSTNCSASIQSYGNGWYRCIIQSTGLVPQTLSTREIAVFFETVSGSTSNYIGSAGNGIYVYGAQIELTTTSSATTYIPTTATSASSTATYGAPSFLLEPQRTNLLVQSNGFGTTWTLNNATLTSSATISPDGTNNAWKLNETLVTDTHDVRQGTAVTVTAGTRYIVSAYVKPAERNQVALQNQLGGGYDFIRFNLTGTGSVYPLQYAGHTASITPVGNGWFRITDAITAGTSGTRYFSINLQSSSINTTPADSYAGISGSYGLYIYGAQIEAMPYTASVTASSYIPTTTAAGTSNEDLLYKFNLQSSGFCTNVWTVFIDYNIKTRSSSLFSYTLDASNNTLWYLVKTPTGINGYDYKNTATIFNTVTSNDASKIAITSDGTTITVYVNGATIGTYTPSNTGTLSIDKIYFDPSDTSILNNPTQTTSIKNFIIYPTALSAVECGFLTQLTT